MEWVLVSVSVSLLEGTSFVFAFVFVFVFLLVFGFEFVFVFGFGFGFVFVFEFGFGFVFPPSHRPAPLRPLPNARWPGCLWCREIGGRTVSVEVGHALPLAHPCEPFWLI